MRSKMVDEVAKTINSVISLVLSFYTSSVSRARQLLLKEKPFQCKQKRPVHTGRALSTRYHPILCEKTHNLSAFNAGIRYGFHRTAPTEKFACPYCPKRAFSRWHTLSDGLRRATVSTIHSMYCAKPPSQPLTILQKIYHSLRKKSTA